MATKEKNKLGGLCCVVFLGKTLICTVPFFPQEYKLV